MLKKIGDEMIKIPGWIWNKVILYFLEHKGFLSTLLGIYIGFNVGYEIVQKYMVNAEFTDQELKTAIVLLVLSMAFVILPSKFVAEFKVGKIIIED